MNPLAKGLALVLLASAMAPLDATAQGVRREMDNMFNGLTTNRTDPSISMGQRRGMISGGSFQARSQIVSVNLMPQFDPPSITAGCGGVDAYFGSISAIGDVKFEGLIRAIMANAKGYAVEVAIGAVSPHLQEIMGKLRDWMSKLNSLQANSCTIAKAAVDGVGNMALGQTYQTWLTQAGVRDDRQQTVQQPGDKSPAEQAIAENREAALKIQPGNYLWRAMKQEKTTQMFPGTGDEFLMDIISLTGTVIGCTKDEASGCSGVEDAVDAALQTKEGGDGLRYFYEYPRLSLMDIVKGGEGRSAMVLRCVGDKSEDGCLKMQPENYTSEGLEKRVMAAFLGTATTPGVIGRFRAGQDAPSQADNNLLANTGSFAGMVLNIARRDPRNAEMFVREFSAEIAAEIAYELVQQMIHNAQIAAGRSTRITSQEAALNLLERARLRLNEERKQIQGDGAVRGQRMAMYKNIIDTIPARNQPTGPIAMRGTGS
jgi:conjugative transfer pilus assembly protein TraH